MWPPPQWPSLAPTRPWLHHLPLTQVRPWSATRSDAAISPALRDLPVSSPPADAGEVPEGQPDPGTVPGGDSPEAANDSGSAQREIVGEAPADLVPVNSFAGGTADSLRGPVSRRSSRPTPWGMWGPNHYVQMVNITYQIWDKQGTSLAGPTNINALWSGCPAGTPCRETNDGDPIVLYDQAADRWMLAQFSVRGSRYQMCIAYSTTPDPTGTLLHLCIRHARIPRLREVRHLARRSLHVDLRGLDPWCFVFDRTADARRVRQPLSSGSPSRRVAAHASSGSCPPTGTAPPPRRRVRPTPS